MSLAVSYALAVRGPMVRTVSWISLCRAEGKRSLKNSRPKEARAAATRARAKSRVGVRRMAQAAFRVRGVLLTLSVSDGRASIPTAD
jgi:hypothetical protein